MWLRDSCSDFNLVSKKVQKRGKALLTKPFLHIHKSSMGMQSKNNNGCQPELISQKPWALFCNRRLLSPRKVFMLDVNDLLKRPKEIQGLIRTRERSLKMKTSPYLQLHRVTAVECIAKASSVVSTEGHTQSLMR